jgi:hypothetical protein
MTGKLLFGKVGRGRKAVQDLMFQVHGFNAFQPSYSPDGTIASTRVNPKPMPDRD